MFPDSTLHQRLSIVLLSGFVLLIFAIPSVTAAYASGGNIPFVAGTTTNKNPMWAGYGIAEPRRVVPIQGIWISFIQPKVICNSTMTRPQAVEFLGGIDGPSPSDFAYVGTEAYCAVGSSFPKYNLTAFGSSSMFPVKAGDKIFGEINISVGVFLVDVYDNNSMKGIKATPLVGSSMLTKAECIVSSVIEATGLPLPLAKFRPAEFGQDYAGAVPFVPLSCNIAVGPNSGFGNPVGSAASGSFSLIKYIMLNLALTQVRAKPSALTTDASSFIVRWKSYGP